MLAPKAVASLCPAFKQGTATWAQDGGTLFATKAAATSSKEPDTAIRPCMASSMSCTSDLSRPRRRLHLAISTETKEPMGFGFKPMLLKIDGAALAEDSASGNCAAIAEHVSRIG